MYQPHTFTECMNDCDDEIQARLRAEPVYPERSDVPTLDDLLRNPGRIAYVRGTGNGRIQLVCRPSRRGNERGTA